MPFEEVQAHPSREGATVPPLTPATTNTAAAPKLSASRPRNFCKQYNGGWANQEFECPRLREGGKCPYYHDQARRKSAIAKKTKESEERNLAQRQRAVPPAKLQDDVKPNRNALQSLSPNQFGKCSKTAEKTNVTIQQSSAIPNTISPSYSKPKKSKEKCRQYAKFGQCKKLDCAYRHVGPHPQELRRENREGADAELSLATSSKVAPSSKGVSLGAESVQDGLKAISPQLAIDIPSHKTQKVLNPMPPQTPICTPAPQSQKDPQKMLPPTIGEAPHQGTSFLQNLGSDSVPKQSSAMDTPLVVAEKKAINSESSIGYKFIQSLAPGSEPLDKSHKRGMAGSEICRFYKRYGTCRYNKHCHRSHDVIPDRISAMGESEQPSIQPSRDKFTASTRVDVNPQNPPISSTSDIREKHNEKLAVQLPQKDHAVPVRNNIQVSNQNSAVPPNIPHQKPTHTSRRFCFAFAKSGRCKLGGKCPYPHVDQENSLQKEHVSRLAARLPKIHPFKSSSQDAREEFAQASSNNTTRASQDVRLELPQRPNRSFGRGSQDIREEVTQKSENTVMRSSQDIRREFFQAPNHVALVGSQDLRKGVPQMPSKSVVQGDSQDVRQENPTSVDTTSVSANDIEQSPSENQKPQSLSQAVASQALPQTACPSSSWQRVKGVCDFYSRMGWCRNKDACKYSHVLPTQIVQGSEENRAGQIHNLSLAGNSNNRSTEAIKGYTEESSLEQSDVTSEFEGKTSQRSSGSESLSSLPVKSQPTNEPKPKKKNSPWKDDPSREFRPSSTWTTYSEPATLPSVDKTPKEIDTSSYSEVAKLPSQKNSSVKWISGASPVREKRYEIPKVLCAQDCQPIEAFPYDPRERVTDMGHGSWDTDYTLVSWLINNLRSEKLAETFARYRHYLERGVIPLSAVGSSRDFQSHVNLASFSLLPNEIKRMIWEYALIHRRDVKVRLHTWEVEVEKNGEKEREKRNRIMAHALTAPLLRTCQLSRRVALDYYKLAFGTKSGSEARIHIDFKLDRLFILHPDPNQLIDVSQSLYSRDLGRVRNLGIPMLHWIQGSNEMFFNAIAQFRHLRELSLVVGDGVKDATYWKGRRICPFIARKLQEVWAERYPGVRSPEVFYQVIEAVQAKHWGIDGIGFSGLVCGSTDWLSRWKNNSKRD